MARHKSRGRPPKKYTVILAIISLMIFSSLYTLLFYTFLKSISAIEHTSFYITKVATYQ